MSEGNLTTKTVTIQPREFETEEMIEKIEPFLESLPQFFRDIFQHYRETKYDRTTRREESRSKLKTYRPNESEKKQRERHQEELRKIAEKHKSDLLEQKKASGLQLQQKIDHYEALLEKTNDKFEKKLKEKDDQYNFRRSTDNDKLKERYNDELHRIKEKHRLDLLEQKKSYDSQLDQHNDDYEALLEKTKDEFESKLKEKHDYNSAEMSANRTAMDEQKEKYDNDVLQLLDQHENALLEEKRLHDSHLDQLRKEYQKHLKEQIDVFENKLLEKEEYINLVKKKLLIDVDNWCRELTQKRERDLESSKECLTSTTDNNNPEEEQTVTKEFERLRKEIEKQEAQFRAKIEGQAKDFSEKQQELLLQLEDRETKLRGLEQSMEGTVKKELFQKLEAEHLQKESQLKHWVEKQTVQFGNEKLKYEQQVQYKESQIKDLTAGIKKTRTENEQMKQCFKEELEKKNKELESYISRLAAISEMKVQSDQRKVENTLSRHRRSDIEKEFREFFDQDRIDACDVAKQCYRNITDVDESIYIPRLVCMIFEKAYETALFARKGFYEIAQKSILHLVSNAAEVGRHWTVCKNFGAFPDLHVVLKERTDIDRSLVEEICGVVDGMLLLIKENADACPLTPLIKDLKESVEKTWACADYSKCLPRYAGYSILKKLERYFELCVLLAWRMVTQVPPLCLDFTTERKYDGKLQEYMGYHPSMVSGTKPQNGSGPNSKQEIACYLWPILHDGKNVLQKGKVFLKLN